MAEGFETGHGLRVPTERRHLATTASVCDALQTLVRTPADEHVYDH